MQRLDFWLWCARFFKTRRLAAAAVDGGRVELNGQRTKPGKRVEPGAAIRIRLGPLEYRVSVLDLARRRGPPAEAASLYREEPESRAARERLAEQQRALARAFPRAKGRPTKRARRELTRLKQREP